MRRKHNMKTLRKITLILVFVFAVLVCASCNNCSKEKTMVVPSISSPDDTFIKIGDFKVTKKEAYHQLLNSYGTEIMLNMLDEKLIPTYENDATFEEEFKEYLDGIIYGSDDLTEEEKTKALQEFIDELPLSGLTNNPTDANYYEKYYRLVFRRIKAARAYYEAQLKEDAITDENLEATFNSTYHKTNDLIIVAFDSNVEANDYLTRNAVDLDHLNTGWQKADGTKFSDDEVLAIFEKIYQDLYEVTTSGIKTYKYEDLTKINASLATDVNKMSVKGYTKTPIVYGSMAYLVYKNAESKTLDEDGNEVNFEDMKDEMRQLIINNAVSNNYVTMYSQKNQLLNSLKIYDKGLQNNYRLTYENVYSSLSYAAGDYPSFTNTNEDSDKYVFSYKLNGEVVNVSADDIYNQLITYYGDHLASLYIKQYVVLKDNDVYDIVNNKILDQEAYDDLFDEEVKEYKDAFDNGDYTSLGYPSSYGWNNFIRDYLGLLSEEKIIVNLDSSLYTESLDTFKETLYLQEESVDGNGNTIPVDQKVQEKMDEIFTKYFNATAIAINAYYDKDLDGVADEDLTDEQVNLAKELVKTVYKKAKEVKTEAISTTLDKIILEYRISTKYTEGIWQQFKKAGLKLKTISSATYNSSSSQDEVILDQLRTQYSKLLSFDSADNGVDLSGQDLSTKYTYVKNDASYTVRSTDFIDVDSEEQNDLVVCNNTVALYFVTKVVKPYYISSVDKTYKPSRKDYTDYLEDSSSPSSNTRNCLTTYYIPAVNELTSDTIVNNALVDESKKLLTSIDYSGNKEALENYLNANIIVEEE